MDDIEERRCICGRSLSNCVQRLTIGYAYRGSKQESDVDRSIDELAADARSLMVAAIHAAQEVPE